MFIVFFKFAAKNFFGDCKKKDLSRELCGRFFSLYTKNLQKMHNLTDVAINNFNYLSVVTKKQRNQIVYNLTLHNVWRLWVSYSNFYIFASLVPCIFIQIFETFCSLSLRTDKKNKCVSQFKSVRIFLSLVYSWIA